MIVVKKGTLVPASLGRTLLDLTRTAAIHLMTKMEKNTLMPVKMVGKWGVVDALTLVTATALFRVAYHIGAINPMIPIVTKVGKRVVARYRLFSLIDAILALKAHMRVVMEGTKASEILALILAMKVAIL
jgi:hypothetical protein